MVNMGLAIEITPALTDSNPVSSNKNSSSNKKSYASVVAVEHQSEESSDKAWDNNVNGN